MISDVTENNTINNSKENFKENFKENNNEISIFFENVAESLMSLPSFSTNSDTDTQISSAELREIQEFVEFCHEKSNTFDKSNSEEIFK
jgi:hypothetical protein